MKIQVIGVSIFHGQNACSLHFIQNGREHFPQCDYNTASHFLTHAEHLGIKLTSEVTKGKTKINFDLDGAALFVDYEKECERLTAELSSVREQYHAFLDALDWIVKPQKHMTVDQKIKSAHGYRKGYETLKAKLIDMGFQNPKAAAEHIESLVKKINDLESKEKRNEARRARRDEKNDLRKHIEIQNDELNNMRNEFQKQRNDINEAITMLVNSCHGLPLSQRQRVAELQKDYGVYPVIF